jgi:uncharacterized RmlC-like cupin family protein
LRQGQGPGDFIYVPPFVPHQEINASQNESLECVLVRSDNEAVVVNLDIEPIEKPEQVAWIDPIPEVKNPAHVVQFDCMVPDWTVAMRC